MPQTGYWIALQGITPRVPFPCPAEGLPSCLWLLSIAGGQPKGQTEQPHLSSPPILHKVTSL